MLDPGENFGSSFGSAAKAYHPIATDIHCEVVGGRGRSLPGFLSACFCEENSSTTSLFALMPGVEGQNHGCNGGEPCSRFAAWRNGQIALVSEQPDA